MTACLQLHLNTLREHTEVVSDFLENASALSVTWQAIDEQSLYEPPLDSTPLWEHVKISAVFDEHTSLSTLMDALHQAFDEKIIFASHSEILADQAWERKWLQDFKPMRFGKKLWICPSTYEPPVKTAVNIRLDPGLAFGTGTHPSTALCLEWLDAHPLKEKTIIDYGCGSGILAIAAIKCGAKQLTAVDHDPQALAATRMNAEQNDIPTEQLKICLPADFRLQEPVDILLANILAQPLIDLATYFRSLVKPKGHCVLAGILNEQIDAVQQAYNAAGFKIIDIHHQQEWASLVGSAV
ncbi:MAG: ribosomal protein methyltransferase [Pseudomonadota bacterium]|jgi:ribosomal protein L11 methyltransferase